MLRGSARNNLYRCADGRFLALTPLEESFWQALHATLRAASVLSPGELLTQQRLEEIFLQRPCQEWFVLLSDAGIPCAPVRTVDEAAHDAEAASYLLTGKEERVSPLRGANTAAWLRELGYSEEHIAALEKSRVIAIASPTVESGRLG
jgi:crotonobetainyl-CoA:carnitine CoA-transferase CaiB-like acyl-CoA transferase